MNKVAETYLNMACDCPHCGETLEVEWVDKCEQELSEWECECCKESFDYHHPESNYF